MKKIMIIISQILIFIFIYEISSNLFSQVIIMLFKKLIDIPLINIYSSYFFDGTYYTIMPICIAILITVVFMLLYKKIGIYIQSVCAILIYLIYVIISTFVSVVLSSGIISWKTINYIWYCAVFLFSLYNGLKDMINIKINISEK